MQGAEWWERKRGWPSSVSYKYIWASSLLRRVTRVSLTPFILICQNEKCSALRTVQAAHSTALSISLGGEERGNAKATPAPSIALLPHSLTILTSLCLCLLRVSTDRRQQGASSILYMCDNDEKNRFDFFISCDKLYIAIHVSRKNYWFQRSLGYLKFEINLKNSNFFKL